MAKNVLSVIALLVGTLSWAIRLINYYFLIDVPKTSILSRISSLFTAYSLLSGVVIIAMLIAAVMGYRQNRSIVVLILNIIINGTYLIYYIMMVRDILKNVLN